MWKKIKLAYLNLRGERNLLKTMRALDKTVRIIWKCQYMNGNIDDIDRWRIRTIGSLSDMIYADYIKRHSNG